MKVSRFEELVFWQKSRELTKLVYSHTRDGGFRSDFALSNQIQRASVSVMSNIAEGFGRGSNKEFIQFLFIAKGSLSEVKSLVYVAQDLKYITDNDARLLHERTEEIAKFMSAFMNRIKLSPQRGVKHA